MLHHVKCLLWCRAANPNSVQTRALVRDFRPALARQFTDFRAPVGKGLRLDADELLLKCSCHVDFFRLEVSTSANDVEIACCRSVVKVAIPQRRESEFPMNARRLSWVTVAPPSSGPANPLLLGDEAVMMKDGGSGNRRSAYRDCVTGSDSAQCPNRPTDLSGRWIQP
jgi:hypothetical protein